MLSLERCRKILGSKTLSDTEIEKLRDAIYAVSENIIDEYILSCANIKNKTTCKRQLSTVEFPQNAKKMKDTA
jgi:hypothetical protein